MKMCHVCYYNNSDATFRLLMSGDMVLISFPFKLDSIAMQILGLQPIPGDPKDNGVAAMLVSEVQPVLEALDVTKATGPDKIPTKLLEETASVIAPSLCKLFNKSLSTGSFPQNWNEANVVPVFKKGEVECTENYRPISLPSLITKVLERCVFNTLKIDCTR